MTSSGKTSVADFGRLRALSKSIAAGELSPTALVERCFARVDKVDAAVQCWRAVDREGAFAVAAERAAEATSGALRGPLHGIPFAVKDIIDVAGMTTLANSHSREGSAPAMADAEIVLALKRQGAIPVGKVHTTEFAFFDPSPARNPHNLDHTPGGSSSGSAAAVAAGMVPLALGTQTVASVNRPAAYCGIAAFKPSTRSTCTFGITPLAPSYDTVGFMAQTVDDAVFAFQAVCAPFQVAAMQPARLAEGALEIVVPQDAHIADCDVEIAGALERARAVLQRAGHRVTLAPAPIDFARLFALQRSTMLYEAGRALHGLLAMPAQSVGAKLRAAIVEGLEIPQTRYLDERGDIEAMRAKFWPAISGFDACLWPATPATAPVTLAWTGDPKYIAPWTALAGPIVSLPIGFSASGMPIGAILSSAPGSDAGMCAIAGNAARALGV